MSDRLSTLAMVKVNVPLTDFETEEGVEVIPEDNPSDSETFKSLFSNTKILNDNKWINTPKEEQQNSINTFMKKLIHNKGS